MEPARSVTGSVCDVAHRVWPRPSALHVVRIGVAPVGAIRRDELLRVFDEAVEQRKSVYACFCEAHLCVCAWRDGRVRRVLEEATLCLPDGVATTWGARLLGARLPERLTGPSLMLELCRHGLDRGYRHFFYGGTAGIADRLAQKLRERFPGLQVAGTYSPPFRELTPAEDEATVDMINACDPDVVWVGLGAPKQEIWAHDHCGRLSAPLILPVGAAFDFHSGNRKWAPAWIRRIGCEWIYRMFTGGRQVFLRYARNQPMFVALILKQAAWQALGRGKRQSEKAGEEYRLDA